MLNTSSDSVLTNISLFTLTLISRLLFYISVQKQLIYDEQEKIQNLQAQEIAKLKNLLNFREQVSCPLQLKIFHKIVTFHVYCRKH